MRIFLISDNHDTLTGMRLAGVDGIVVHEEAELLDELKKARESGDIGILLITETLAERLPEEINRMKLSKKLPLVIEIPDRHGTRRPPDFLTRYIKEAIGVSI
ncbi:V-type ATP synthase subunit F [Tepidanaerobacter sp. GT38]|uniref:V-type ATP synthase subunit F n=1 Tax=Tepidanaerobacter sp. GT38 TaxID=2722793 RepID=UPI001F398933|nr:V-type ATP synthase subunit F [Tepidanaerobacter sp. GT38]MCG1012065.1 V-type ATP synthase subunit F [Tepidanaerobacter sp. GT38]